MTECLPALFNESTTPSTLRNLRAADATLSLVFLTFTDSKYSTLTGKYVSLFRRTNQLDKWYVDGVKFKCSLKGDDEGIVAGRLRCVNVALGVTRRFMLMRGMTLKRGLMAAMSCERLTLHQNVDWLCGSGWLSYMKKSDTIEERYFSAVWSAVRSR